MPNEVAGTSSSAADNRAVTVEVTIDRTAGTITAKPDSVTIWKDGGPDKPLRVIWAITGMADGDTLVYGDKVEGEPNLFPNFNRVVPSTEKTANSGLPDATGTWLYDLILKNKTGKEIARLDPELGVRQGP